MMKMLLPHDDPRLQGNAMIVKMYLGLYALKYSLIQTLQ